MGPEKANDALIVLAWMDLNREAVKHIYDNGFELEFNSGNNTYEIYAYEEYGGLNPSPISTISSKIAEGYRRCEAVKIAKREWRRICTHTMTVSELSSAMEYLKSVMADYNITQEELGSVL